LANPALAPAQPDRRRVLSPNAALLLPLGFALVIAAIAALPSIRAQASLPLSLIGAAAVLVVGAMALRWLKRSRAFELEIQIRPQHYLQACAQGSVLVYWGWYWRDVYDHVPLLVAQLAFAYAFEMLLVWSRQSTYRLGFGPFPVIFSINLFLWFKADWFYLQFAMIALGFLAKDLIRWNRDGRLVHIFNPSSFPLAIFSIALILTGTTSWTWGEEIATTQFNPPNIYVFLFLIALPGQFLFGVTTMTMSAVVTTYLFGLAYYWATGTYFFLDSYIPIAVFLGMHLLFTDPSTSPRSESARIVFGAIYGLSNMLLYGLLGAVGIPRFYDKLLPVPLMNLSVRFLDRVVPRALSRVDPAKIAPSLTGRRRNATYVGIWAVAFAVLLSVGGVGDNHPGHRVPFWQQACADDRVNGCETLRLLLDDYCTDGSGWACNEVGILRASGKLGAVADAAPEYYAKACRLGFAPGCQNSRRAAEAEFTPRSAPPRLADYPVILRTGKGALPDTTPYELYARACDQGFLQGCEDLAGLHLQAAAEQRDPPKAAAALERACSGGLATACSNLGFMHYTADGVPLDRDQGLALLKRSCDLGYRDACTWYDDATARPE
jgi:hypothetical protein